MQKFFNVVLKGQYTLRNEVLFVCFCKFQKDGVKHGCSSWSAIKVPIHL